MFKFASIGAFDNAINVPYCKVASGVAAQLRNGNGVTIDRTAETMTPTTTVSGKGDAFVIYNVQRRFDYDDFDEEYYKAGDMPLVYKLSSLNGLEVEFRKDAYVMTDATATLTAGTTTLAYGDSGKLVVISSLTGYAAYLKVIAIDGDIVRAEVIVV